MLYEDISRQEYFMKYLSLILILLFSCVNSEPKLLPKAEYLEFGQKMAKQLKAGHTKSILSKFNGTIINDKLLAYIDTFGYKDRASSTKLKSYRVELNEQANGIIKSMAKLAKKGDLEFSNYYEKDGKPHITFSISSVLGNDIIVVSLLSINENTYITNFQSSNTGTDLSQEFICTAINKLGFGWIGGDYMEALEEINNAKVYLNRNQPERAWNALSRINQDLFFQPSFQALKVRTSAQLSDTLYLNSLVEWINVNWENESFRHWKSAEYYNHIGDSISSQKSLDSLSKLVGHSKVFDELQTQLR